MTDAPAQDPTIDWGKQLLATQKKRRMPTFLDPSALPAMRWVSGEPLGEEARVALINLLRREDDKHEVPELRALRGLLDDGDCSAWSKKLESIWSKAGHDARQKWAVYQIGVLGDDARVDAKALKLPSLAANNYWRRATWYLDAFHRLGSPRARSWIFDLFCHAPMKGSVQRHAGELLDDAVAREGSTREDYIHALDLHVRQTWHEERLKHPDLVPGQTTLEHDGRAFVVLMDAEFTLALRDVESGERLHDLPGSDAFAATREALAAFVGEWSEHLQRAMVSARPFSFELLRGRFLSVPVMARLIETLVWRTTDGATLRFADGEPLDADYEPIEVPDDEHLTIAHPLEMSPGEHAAWGEHLVEAELQQVFDQLERPTHTPETSSVADMLAAGDLAQDGLYEAIAQAGWEVNMYTDYEHAYWTFHNRGQRAWLTIEDFSTVSGLEFTDLWNTPLTLDEVDPVVYSEAIEAGRRVYALFAERRGGGDD